MGFMTVRGLETERHWLLVLWQTKRNIHTKGMHSRTGYQIKRTLSDLGHTSSPFILVNLPLTQCPASKTLPYATTSPSDHLAAPSPYLSGHASADPPTVLTTFTPVSLVAHAVSANQSRIGQKRGESRHPRPFLT